MKKSERIALARICTDLIKADSVIDVCEMEWYADLKERYRIIKPEETEAALLTFADACTTLAKASEQDRLQMLKDFGDLTLSDGFCAKQEALLMIALHYLLTDDDRDSCEVISIESPAVRIENTQIIYIETKHHQRFNSEIHDNYRQISKEAKVSGFDFIYIPNIAGHYKSTPSQLFHQVVSFIAPHLSDADIDSLVDHLSHMTTSEFCKDQLCNKLGMRSLRESNPALLLKIGDSFANQKLYTNFLKIDVIGSILETLQVFLDKLSRMESSDTMVIKNIEESEGQFLYHGFYKQLFDIYLLRSSVRSSIVINPFKEIIELADIHIPINGLHRREKALYTLFLIESRAGGINFNQPESVKNRESYNKRIKQIQEKYNRIYEWFGGEASKAPNLEQPELRRPMISCIKRCIALVSDHLHHADDYIVSKNSFGHFNINLEPDLLFIIDPRTEAKVPLFESELYKRIKNL